MTINLKCEKKIEWITCQIVEIWIDTYLIGDFNIFLKSIVAEQLTHLLIIVKNEGVDQIDLLNCLQDCILNSNKQVIVSPIIGNIDDQILAISALVKVLEEAESSFHFEINDDQLFFLILNLPNLINYYNLSYAEYPIEQFFEGIVKKFKNIKEIVEFGNFGIN